MGPSLALQTVTGLAFWSAMLLGPLTVEPSGQESAQPLAMLMVLHSGRQSAETLEQTLVSRWGWQ